MSIEKRLERVEAILDARGLDWDHPRVASDHFAGANKMVAEEPPKKWRILEPGEVVCSGDRVTAKTNPPSDPPHGLGWRPVDASVGTSVCEGDPCIFARLVADEPAKEPEPAEEPPKKWRRLTDEFVQPGDWANAKVNRQDVDPPDGGWIPADPCYFGRRACTLSMYFARPVADEPAKEPEHPAGPVPDPGEGYRILSKNPPEELAEGDEFLHPGLGRWAQSVKSMCGGKKQDVDCWYRRKIGFPAKEPEPAWEPKVGDWVRVTRPEDWIEWRHPRWEGSMHKSDGMHKFDGQVGQIEREREGHFQIRGFVASKECSYIFHRDWLSPAKPPKDEYREPVLPADLGKWAEFSQDGINWIRYKLCGCYKEPESSLAIWSEKNIGFRHCRIKKDA